MPKQIQKEGRRWYAIHVYSGYEENVAENLRQRVDSMNMSDRIFQIIVPTEKRIKIRNGRRRVIREKIFPGYVLIEMDVTDDSWYLVRNTPSVTGFIGSGTTPIPLAEEEVKSIQKRIGVEEPKYKIDIDPGSPVRIIDGPFKGFEGKISEVDEERGRVKVLITVFGRETPAELDFLQLKKL
ncbi:transcription termination/antitermination protein NusG [Patescibacteria group bacterium]|nr:transcription termination/antitermination protein NusG [Patescibacteria group bacterium]